MHLSLQPPTKRARKRHGDSAPPLGTRAVAKRRGKGREAAGSLSGLMNMPLDVFFQVAAHLHPLDMLNLARASKSLRSIVLAKSTRSAWIASLATVDSIPSCPEDMSESLHAALLFDQYCLLCGVDRARWVDYAIRLRLCKACYKANILKGSAILGRDQADLFQTLPLFPCETGSDYERAGKFASKEKRTAAQKYYAAEVRATVDKHTSLQRKSEKAAAHFVAETLISVSLAHQHAVIVLAWLKGRSLTKQLNNIEIMSDRKATIIERLQELGYTEDDFPEDEQVWERLINQPKRLTDRIWNNLLPKLEEQLALEQDRRTQEAFEERVDDRLDVIVLWYDEYVNATLTSAEGGLLPNLCDARELPSILALAQSNDARGELSQAAFLALTKEVFADAEEYKARAKRELADILCRHAECRTLELEDLPADAVLERFCAYFMCIRGCEAVADRGAFLTYEELHAHWREEHPDNPWLHGDDEDRWDAEERRVKVPNFWPRSDLSAPFVGKRALEAAGVPLDMPRAVLDAWTRAGRLFCACGDPRMPVPEEMSWSKLLYHLLTQTYEHEERALEMRFLDGKHNPKYVLRDNHLFEAGDDCCVKFLPESADASAASVRITVSDSLRAEIEAKLATRVGPGVVPQDGGVAAA
ncbi:hypothetical protein GSI_03186 [Ganoderma sinense ZZ0214-1]|uniref:F-box domain-containing protein n=1 Tax=Ganoderma sinense ZZ0214-1 TaxID=1077348 RepID=A0A2G8SKX4_9APHY|nr:hypothetical protein GSI_03186 [Ganoderma sinense ZZ0214-1]